eukprot:TCONS_00034700-protein
MVKEPVTTKLDEDVPMEVVQEEPVEHQYIGKFKILEDKDETALVSKSVLKELKLHNTSVIEPEEEMDENEETDGRKVVIDNFDFTTNVNDETESHKNQDFHWVSRMATENRMGFPELSTENDRSVKTLENGCLLPQISDHVNQRKDYVALVARVIVKHLKCLEFLKDAVVNHIKHKFSQLTTKTNRNNFSWYDLSKRR